MDDKIHQPYPCPECLRSHSLICITYRQKLVPGLADILELNHGKPTHKSLLGVCMSGAGPSVLALTRSGNEEERKAIAKTIQVTFANIWYKCLCDILGLFCKA